MATRSHAKNPNKCADIAASAVTALHPGSAVTSLPPSNKQPKCRSAATVSPTVDAYSPSNKALDCFKKSMQNLEAAAASIAPSKLQLPI